MSNSFCICSKLVIEIKIIQQFPWLILYYFIVNRGYVESICSLIFLLLNYTISHQHCVNTPKHKRFARFSYSATMMCKQVLRGQPPRLYLLSRISKSYIDLFCCSCTTECIQIRSRGQQSSTGLSCCGLWVFIHTYCSRISGKDH